jgi:chemotaxis protein methyltransferase CheR
MTDRECVALLQWALPRLGLRWPGFRRVRRQVCKRISRRMAELGLSDADAYRARLESDRAEWSVLDTCCWISVSRFYRDRRVFENLTNHVLPELARAAIARKRLTLRAWSAGCASGEEPYSLALAWHFGVAPDFSGMRLQIVATDASAALLERAKRAVYTASTLRELPAAWRSAAFEPLDRGYRLRGEFRSGIEFRREDIRHTMPAGPFDLILCRNLAFTYFDLELQRKILAGLVKRLEPDGALLVGSHEALPEPLVIVGDTETPGLYRAPKNSARAVNGSAIGL